MPTPPRFNNAQKLSRAQIIGATTHYEVLGVAPCAGEETIKEGHRALARLFHPDRCRHPEAHDLMVKVNEAYAVLGDKAARRRYDAVNKTTSGVCEDCGGTGHKFKQQGFKMKQRVACPTCHGSGQS